MAMGNHPFETIIKKIKKWVKVDFRNLEYNNKWRKKHLLLVWVLMGILVRRRMILMRKLIVVMCVIGRINFHRFRMSLGRCRE